MPLRVLALWAILASVVTRPSVRAFDEEQSWGTLKGQFLYDGEPPEVKLFDGEKVNQDFGHPIASDTLVVDRESRGVANIAIWISPPRDQPLAVHPMYAEQVDKPVEMTTEEGRILPHVVLVRVSQILKVTSRDKVAHNQSLLAPGDTPP